MPSPLTFWVAIVASQRFEETACHLGRRGRAPDSCLGRSSTRDPFDRMLIAQALARNIPLISNEPLFDRYGVRRLW